MDPLLIILIAAFAVIGLAVVVGWLFSRHENISEEEVPVVEDKTLTPEEITENVNEAAKVIEASGHAVRVNPPEDATA